MCTATIPEAMPDGALHTDGDGGEVKCVLGHWIEDHHPHRCLCARIPSVCSQSPAPWSSQAHTLPHLRQRLRRTRSINLSYVWPNEVLRNKTVGFLFKQDNRVLAACSGPSVLIFVRDLFVRTPPGEDSKGVSCISIFCLTILKRRSRIALSVHVS